MNEPLILCIEDDADIRRFLKSTLAANAMQTLEAATAKEGLQLASSRSPDIILLDLGLPDMDGMDLIRRLREWGTTPIVVLSARDRERDKVAALELGADDYLTKPFSAAELIARIRVAQRHAGRQISEAAFVFDRGGLFIDNAARCVRVDGAEIRLTPIEYKLLLTLARHADKVLPHSTLLAEVWGRHGQDTQTYLRIHTQHLREKLKDDPLKPRFIFTEPGIGYRLRA
ncbi:response regulator [Asticcacaulis sp. EMRT-3]|uniref:response regulator n=1 Tax=Asticcacaulis sp. EMRT-3 TaxID=3040349 RepID=UPI0024AF679F|nr:response regulator [Asticcacaulis sp. EMRT-3]MDI7776014.1 response regulator [Asticcacaulis sp. EMRT-3]